MRTPFALVAAVVLAAAAPPAARDWRTAASVTPIGSVLIGNPAAKTKLVEYLSFTCSHCGDFVAESKAPLHDSLVRQGKVSVETRAAVRDPYDLAAWSLARCAPPQTFAPLSVAIFAAREQWTAKGEDYARANLDKLKAMSQPQQIRAVIDNSGLGAIGVRHGVTPAALDRCLASPTQRDQLVEMTKAAFKKIPGTPGFEINGKMAEGASWAALSPQLAAAGAK